MPFTFSMTKSSSLFPWLNAFHIFHDKKPFNYSVTKILSPFSWLRDIHIFHDKKPFAFSLTKSPLPFSWLNQSPSLFPWIRYLFSWQKVIHFLHDWKFFSFSITKTFNISMTKSSFLMLRKTNIFSRETILSILLLRPSVKGFSLPWVQFFSPFIVDPIPERDWCAVKQTGSHKSYLPCQKW